MPLYNTMCKDCKFEEEIMLRLSELDDPVHCTLCGGEVIRVCGNQGGFRLDNSGWAAEGYATHYGDATKFKGGA